MEPAVRLQDRDQQIFVLVGILSFTDKIIDAETADKIRRRIQMTKGAMIFEREKEEPIAKAVNEEQRKSKRASWETKRNTALRMLADGELPPAKIADYSGLDLKTVTELSQNVS